MSSWFFSSIPQGAIPMLTTLPCLCERSNISASPTCFVIPEKGQVTNSNKTWLIPLKNSFQIAIGLIEFYSLFNWLFEINLRHKNRMTRRQKNLPMSLLQILLWRWNLDLMTFFNFRYISNFKKGDYYYLLLCAQNKNKQKKKRTFYCQKNIAPVLVPPVKIQAPVVLAALSNPFLSTFFKVGWSSKLVRPPWMVIKSFGNPNFHSRQSNCTINSGRVSYASLKNWKKTHYFIIFYSH